MKEYGDRGREWYKTDSQTDIYPTVIKKGLKTDGYDSEVKIQTEVSEMVQNMQDFDR